MQTWSLVCTLSKAAWLYPVWHSTSWHHVLRPAVRGLFHFYQSPGDQENVCGVLKVVYHGDNQVSVTYIRHRELGKNAKLCKWTLGYDANLLYLRALKRAMPTGHFIRDLSENFESSVCQPTDCLRYSGWNGWQLTSVFKYTTCTMAVKVARHPWAPRIVLKFAIKSRYVLDSWKKSCCPWIFSGVLENSWIVFKLFIYELLITLSIQESRINNVN